MVKEAAYRTAFISAGFCSSFTVICTLVELADQNVVGVFVRLSRREGGLVPKRVNRNWGRIE